MVKNRYLNFIYFLTVSIYLLSFYKLLIQELSSIKVSLLLFLFLCFFILMKDKVIKQNPIILTLYFLWCIWSLIPSFLFLKQEFFVMNFGYMLVGLLVLVYIPNLIQRIGIHSFLNHLILILYIVLGLGIVLGVIYWTEPYTYNSLTGENRFRLYWFFDHPNYLGLICMILIFLTTLKSEKIKGSIVLPLLLVVLADSRTALFCILIFYILIFILKIMKAEERLLSMMFLVSSLTICVFSFIYLLGTNLNVLLSNRLAIWGRFFSNDNFNYIIGNGLSYNALKIDNWYIDILYQTGVIGLLIMLAFLIVTFFLLSKATKVNLQKKIVIISIYLTCLVYSLAESNFLLPGSILTITIWPILGWLCLSDK